MHLMALHQDGSNNPEGIASTSDRIRFHPYYTSKDLVGFFWMAVLLALFGFYMANDLGHLDDGTPTPLPGY
jgi:ubiquinol-cytochrome c reductase cytochrome b subunit